MTSIVNSLTGGSIDIQSLAKSLTDAERAPQQAILDAQKTTAQNRISSIGRIYSAANDMKTAIAAYGDPKALAFQPQTSDAATADFTFRPFYPPSAIDFTFKVTQLATTNSVTMAPVHLNESLAPSPDLNANSTVQFDALASGSSVSVGGLTLTASAAMSAADVAAAFASVVDGKQGATTKGAFSGSLSGWSSGAAANNVVTFTNAAGSMTGDGSPAAIPARVFNIYLGTRPAAGAPDAAPVASFDLSRYSTLDSLRNAIKATTGFDANILTSTVPGSPDQRYLSVTHGTGSANNFYVETLTGGAPDSVGSPSSGLRVPASATNASDPGQSYGVNAKVEANGIVSESGTNSFSNLISGVTINVKAVTGSGTVRLSTSSDMTTFTDALRSVVSTYNSLMTTISNEVKYDPDITKRGGLANDFVAKNFMQQMSRMTTSEVAKLNGKSLTLADVGVRTNIDGTLTIDETQLSKVKDANPEYLSAVMTSTSTTTGALDMMTKVSDAVLGTGSNFVALYNKTANTDVPKIDDEITALNDQMDAIQARYLKQFTDMQNILNQTQATQSSLTSSMAAWTNSLKA